MSEEDWKAACGGGMVVRMGEMVVAFLVLILAPFCMGLLPAMAMPGESRGGEGEQRGEGKGKRRPNVYICPMAVYLAGLLLALAVFQIFAVPVILLKVWGFPLIVKGYSLLLLLGSAAGLAAGTPILRGYAERAGRLFFDKRRLSMETCLYWALAAGLVLFQIYMAYTRAFFDGDDAYYVVQSVIAQQSDVLYRVLPYTGLSTSLDIRHALAPLPLWEAYVAEVTGIHPAIIAHSVLPLVLIPATYLLYFQIGAKLFRADGRKTALFLILVSLLQIFGNTSIYTNATFFLMRTWQGKSLLCNLVLLSEVWILLNLWEREKNGKDKESQAGWWLVLCASHTTAALCTTMGAFLVGLLVAVTGLVWAVRERRPALLLPLAACCIPCIVYLVLFVGLG